MKINSINLYNNSNYKQNFGLKIDKGFQIVVKKARSEVFSSGIIHPDIWKYTKNFIKRLQKTFPKGEMNFRQTEQGLVPQVLPFPKQSYISKNLNPEIYEMNTVLLQKGACHGKDIRNLTFEIENLEKKLRNRYK